MNDGLAFSALTEKEQEQFRTDLLWELRRLIMKYNGNSGTSIRTEIAESIFQSMMYCVSGYLRTVSDPAQAIRETPGGELYRKSLACIKGEIRRAKRLYCRARATRIDTDLRVYNDTLDGGIPGFFQLYDPQFAAQETPVLLDYPLQTDLSQKSGIFYIQAYLQEFIRENTLCKKYRKNQIRAALFLHGQKHHLEYHEIIVNIPQLMEKPAQAQPPSRAL